MQYVTLSHWLEDDSPVHIGLRRPEIIPNSQISRGDGYNSFLINVENHSGTHIDAPDHFLDNSKQISEYIPHELIFKNPIIMDTFKGQNELIELKDVVDADLNDVDCIFFRTDFEKYRDSDPEKYLTQNPGISPEVIYWIRENFKNVRCVGIDCISISSYQNPNTGKEAHLNAFKNDGNFGAPLLLIEDMKLGDISNGDLKCVIVVPWQIKGIDSAPCTVIAEIGK